MSGSVQETPVARPAAWELPPPSGAFAESGSRVVDYVLLRVTGLALSVLVLGHFAVTHLVTDVARDDSTFVARRLSSAVWIAWDTTMLVAALAHGTAGVRLAVADYAGGRRRLLERGVVSLASILLVLGAVAIVRAADA